MPRYPSLPLLNILFHLCNIFTGAATLEALTFCYLMKLQANMLLSVLKHTNKQHNNGRQWQTWHELPWWHISGTQMHKHHQRSNVTDVSHRNVLVRDRWTTSVLLAEVWPDICHFCLSVHLCACRLRPETICAVQANWWRQNTSHMITAGERQVDLWFSVHCVILSIIQSDVCLQKWTFTSKIERGGGSNSGSVAASKKLEISNIVLKVFCMFVFVLIELEGD